MPFVLCIRIVGAKPLSFARPVEEGYDARVGKDNTMNREALRKRISIDPAVCCGKPCIRGTRIWVSRLVDNLAEGVSEKELLEAYPQLTLEDIRAARACAADMTRERVIPVSTDPVEA